jgi:hypothetical protein
VPTADTAKAVYDTLDFTRALDVYSNSFRGASFAVRKSELASISSEKMTTPPVPATSSMPL